MTIYQGHQGVVEDVAWHQHHQDIFGSVGDDKRLILWDMRKPPTQVRCWGQKGGSVCVCVCVCVVFTTWRRGGVWRDLIPTAQCDLRRG
jgi:hypothetical protein